MRAQSVVLSLLGAFAFYGCGLSLVGEDPGVRDAGGQDAQVRPEASLPRSDASIPDVIAPADTGVDSASDAADAGPVTSVGPAARAFNSLVVDRVSFADGPITPDGQLDGAFDVEVTGPAIAVALISTDATGAPAGGQQWDTWVGTDAVPAALGTGYVIGSQTVQLAVREGGGDLNDGDGRASIPAGKHTLRIFASSANTFTAGNYFRVVVQDPQGELVSGPAFAY